MEIAGYLQTSLIEWPGKISAVVFVPGCNFRCPFCYNRDLVLNPGKLPRILEKEILTDLEKRKKWIDGVVVSGGEPLLSTELLSFLKKIKNRGFLTKIFTNGSNPKFLKQLLAKGLLDEISMDIKGLLDGRYSKAADVSFDLGKILKSAQLVLESGIEFQFVTTIVPGIHDKKTLVEMAKQLKKIVGRKKIPWIWQNFQPKNCLDPKFEKIKPYKKEKLEEFLKAAKKYYPTAELRAF